MNTTLQKVRTAYTDVVMAIDDSAKRDGGYGYWVLTCLVFLLLLSLAYAVYLELTWQY